MALGDLEFRALVQRLATDESAVRALGIDDQRHIDYVQEHAVERLAGRAARPR